MKKSHRKYLAVMILCFIFGGFALILYSFQAYSVLWHGNLVGSVEGGQGNFSASNFADKPPEDNASGVRRRPKLISLLTSPFSIVNLLSGIVSLAAGFSIWSLLRKKEVKNTEERILDLTLLEDEKKVFDVIQRYNGSITQNKIVKSTKFSKVKVHRIIKKFIAKGLVEKYPHGMTNKIVSTGKINDDVS